MPTARSAATGEDTDTSVTRIARFVASMSAKRAHARDDAPLIEAFLDMMSAERGASINTLAAYRRDLIDFSAARAKTGAISKPRRANR